MIGEIDSKGSKIELVEGLKIASRGTSRSNIARLRDIFDEVEAARILGLSFKEIVAVLADRGLVFNLGTFRHTRLRIKKERACDKQNKGTVL